MAKRKLTSITDLHRMMLDDAREGKGQDVIVAAAILESSATAPMIVYTCLENGDDEGIGFIDEFVDDVHAARLLRRGESIKRVVLIARQLEPISSTVGSSVIDKQDACSFKKREGE